MTTRRQFYAKPFVPPSASSLSHSDEMESSRNSSSVSTNSEALAEKRVECDVDLESCSINFSDCDYGKDMTHAEILQEIKKTSLELVETGSKMCPEFPTYQNEMKYDTHAVRKLHLKMCNILKRHSQLMDVIEDRKSWEVANSQDVEEGKYSDDQSKSTASELSKLDQARNPKHNTSNKSSKKEKTRETQKRTKAAPQLDDSYNNSSSSKKNSGSKKKGKQAHENRKSSTNKDQKKFWVYVATDVSDLEEKPIRKQEPRKNKTRSPARVSTRKVRETKVQKHEKKRNCDEEAEIEIEQTSQRSEHQFISDNGTKTTFNRNILDKPMDEDAMKKLESIVSLEIEKHFSVLKSTYEIPSRSEESQSYNKKSSFKYEQKKQKRSRFPIDE